jgi:hypothetical protein
VVEIFADSDSESDCFDETGIEKEEERYYVPT